MENVESTAAALANSLVVEESEGADQMEVLAEALGSGETQQEETPAADAPEQESAQQEDAAQTETASEGDAGANRQTEIESGIRDLFENAGWSIEMLQAFSEDAKARSDIAAGRSVAAAANAYAMRLLAGAAGKAPEKSGGKRGVPGIHRPAASETRTELSIDDLTDEQFDAFSKRAQELMKEGKKVRM